MRKVSLYAFTTCLILGSAVASFAAAKPAATASATTKSTPAATSSTAPSTTPTTEKKPVTPKKHKHHATKPAATTPKPGAPKN